MFDLRRVEEGLVIAKGKVIEMGIKKLLVTKRVNIVPLDGNTNPGRC